MVEKCGYKDVIYKETGQKIGWVKANGVGFAGTGGIEISLFGGKYSLTANKMDECWGCMKGVEAVLSHMLSTRAMQFPGRVDEALGRLRVWDDSLGRFAAL